MLTMIYICCLSSSVFFAWLASRTKDKGLIILFSLISILIPSILGGLREPENNTDTMVYGVPHAMQALRTPSLLEFISGKEPGYATVCYFTMKTFNHVNWVFFMYQFITVGGVYIGAYKHRKVVSMSLIMFLFLYMLYLPSYNFIRQSMAAAIIFMGLDHLEHKEYKRFFCYILAAFTFHYSSIAMSVMILGVHMFAAHKSRYRLIIMIIMAGLLAFVRPVSVAILNFIGFSKYLMYVEGGGASGALERIPLMLFSIWEICLLIVYAKGANKLLGRYNVEYYKLNLIIAFAFRYLLRLMDRLAIYSDYVNMIAIAALPLIMKDKKMRYLVWTAIVTVYFMRWYKEVTSPWVNLEGFTYISIF